jgi:hypothetical protein
MMDARAVNRLFLSKKPRIPVVAAQDVKVFFMAAYQSLNLANRAIIHF